MNFYKWWKGELNLYSLCTQYRRQSFSYTPATSKTFISPAKFKTFISASDLELDFFDDNVGFIDEDYKDKQTALLALNDLIAQAVKPVI